MLPAIKEWRSHRLVHGIAAAFLLALSAGAAAEELPATSPTSVPEESAPARTDAAEFCANIGDAASDARFAWEARMLNALKEDIETRTAALEAKRAELEEWVARREDFKKLAEQMVVDIYARMRPDAAAAQLGALDEDTAAAVLAKLNARTAGAILSEMDTRRAVSLAALIAGGGEPQPNDVAQQ